MRPPDSDYIVADCDTVAAALARAKSLACHAECFVSDHELSRREHGIRLRSGSGALCSERRTIFQAIVPEWAHWNNFFWPLIVTNSVETRPLTVGLRVFASVDQGVDWARICAAALMPSAPLMIAFLILQRGFIQSFLRAGIR